MHESELARNGPDAQVHHLPRAYDDGLPSSAIRLSASEHGLVSEEAVFNARLLSVARLLLPLPSPDLANPLKRRFTLRPGAVGGPCRQRRAMRGDHNHDVLCTGPRWPDRRPICGRRPRPP